MHRRKRVNVDRRWWGTSVVRVRVLVAGLALLAAGGMVLGWGSRSRLTAANAAAKTSSSIQTSSPRSSLAGTLLTQNIPAPTLAAIPASFQTPSANPAVASAQAKLKARSLLAGLPLMFEPNQGQADLDPADPRAQFVARGSGYSLLLGSEGAILTLKSSAPARSPNPADPSVARVESLRMKLAGSNPTSRLAASDLLASKSNYILGNDPAKWRSNVPQFARVRYENIYPGISLAFYGNQGKLEYDFQVAPGSDPAQAELEFDGAKRLEMQDGAVVIEAENGAVRLDAPRVYQRVNGRQQPIDGRFVLRADNRVGFAIGPYDHSRELVIDPVLTYATYFGGTGDEHFTQVAIDTLGDIYLAGSTTSANLATAAVFQGTLKGTQNVYIAKIDPTKGSGGLVYVTYLGGSGVDYPVGVAVDGGGQPYVAGTTTSANFPTTGSAYQGTLEAGSAPGSKHVFVTLLNNLAEAPVYSSYLSGNGVDIASGMTIDPKGNIYVTGTTTSIETNLDDQFPASNIPQAQPFQNISKAQGQPQFFVTKVNTNAVSFGSITYSTYFGGGSWFPTSAAPIAVGGGIAVDTNQNIYFTGTTNFTYTGTSTTTDFPILNAYQPCLDDVPPTTPIVNPPVCSPTAALNSNSDAFVAKLNPNLAAGTAQLQWSTYFGGADTETGTGIAVDNGAANIYLTGTTNSFPITLLTTFPPYQACLNNPGLTFTACQALPAPTNTSPTDAYVARFPNLIPTTTTPNLQLTYFSYLGGSGNDVGLALTVDSANGAILTGSTQSNNFPVFPAGTSSLTGPQNAFVARLNTAAVIGQTTVSSWANYYGGSGTDEGTSVTLDSNGAVYMAGDTNSNNLQLSKDLETYQGGFDAFVTQLSPAGSLTVTGSLTLGTDQVYIAAGNQATFTYIITNQGPDLVNNITVSDDIRTSTTSVPVTFDSASVTAGSICAGTTGISASCTIPSLQSGSTATVTIVLTPTPNSTGGTAIFNGGTVSVSSPDNITPAQTSVSAQMSDFSLAVSPNNVSVPAAGDTATYQVQLTPNPVYGTNIGLACSGLPTGPTTCSFSTQTVTLQGASPAAPTLSILTTARPIPLPTTSLFRRHFYAVWLAIPGLAFLGFGAGFGVGGDRRRRRVAGVLLLGLVCMMLVLQPACSGATTVPPVSGTPAGTYPIIVTATSGSDTKSYPITLTVP
jgi:uncharacterized repeat protein (TIGR01451 family)